MTIESPQTPSALSTRRRLVLLALLLLAFAAVSTTVAMTVRETTVRNVMTFGDLSIRAEIAGPGTGGAEASDVWHGGKAERTVRFTNTGSHPMFVRARLGVSAVSQDEKDERPWTEVEYGMSLLDSVDGAEGWVAGPGADGEEGWYYYSQVLAPGATTEPLVTSVELTGDFNALANDGYGFSFEVVGQGVQSEHQVAPAEGELSSLTAVGWPSEDGSGAAGDGVASSTSTAEIAEGVGA